ncbi:hypothetical protein B9Z55_004947 [Caenorhabditis nigoni]|uniref:Uncharacterized protein n=1 Tax=Caenorhabditis nigoni TaxID=1611254 RepID=A0A2G5UYN0_9PELO|nr:hypothetical protein B9Z55_004947 [Caenorhabditis nigoni]
MVIPTLFQLASKAVAQGIDDRKIEVKIILDTESSNAVFRELLKLYPENIRRLKEFRNKLKVDKMDLKKCRIDEEDVLNIQGINLRSLTLGELSQLRDEFPDWYDGSNKSINIVSLLHRLMNKNSRKMMTHLGISGKQEFGMGWEKHVRHFEISVSRKPIRYGYNAHRIIGALLADKVRMQSLEFLDCSLTSVTEHELRGFIEVHPKLETVVAIHTECEKGSIREINVLNNSSVENIIKSLEYTLLTNNEMLSKHCMFHIYKLFETDHEKLQDSEIDDCLKTLCHVLRHGSKDISVVKYTAFTIFAEAKFFETNRFIALFSSEIPAITTLFYQTGRSMKYNWMRKYVFPLLVDIFERTVNSVTFGRLIPTKFLNFLMEETISMMVNRHATPRQGLGILEKLDRLMSWEQYQVISRNFEMIGKLFQLVDNSHFYYYERIIDLAAKFMQKEYSEDMSYIQKFNIVFQYFKESPQMRLLKVLRHLTGMMSENQLKECYKEDVLEVLKSYTKDDCSGQEIGMRFMAISIFCLLLAKNVIADRESINSRIKKFCIDMDFSHFALDHGHIVNMILASKYSTNDCIVFAIRSIEKSSKRLDGFKEVLKTLKNLLDGRFGQYKKKTREYAEQVYIKCKNNQ